MDYTEQFIRLNCSLMSDYKMMKLNADMKCMGLGLYLETILFLRKQQEYKHDFNELDLLADQWGATVENLQHLIKDFDLFLITEDGYFRCLYLDEVMGYQSKLSEQRAAAGSKGGRSSKKSTVKASAKATASTASAIGRGRINEGKNGDASCMDNNKEVYMKSSGAPSMDSKERIYMEPKRLCRASIDKKICGVCGGLAHYLGVDSTVVRLIVVVLALAGTIGIWAYLLAAIIMPESYEY